VDASKESRNCVARSVRTAARVLGNELLCDTAFSAKRASETEAMQNALPCERQVAYNDGTLARAVGTH